LGFGVGVVISEVDRNCQLEAKSIRKDPKIQKIQKIWIQSSRGGINWPEDCVAKVACCMRWRRQNIIMAGSEDTPLLLRIRRRPTTTMNDDGDARLKWKILLFLIFGSIVLLVIGVDRLRIDHHRN